MAETEAAAQGGLALKVLLGALSRVRACFCLRVLMPTASLPMPLLFAGLAGHARTFQPKAAHSRILRARCFLFPPFSLEVGEATSTEELLSCARVAHLRRVFGWPLPCFREFPRE